uniref:Uncharacterized protein n=1 Tax=Rhizophora mucronata TaxID=61149 RepID=A0A2P2QHU3_RHIMU
MHRLDQVPFFFWQLSEFNACNL